MKKLMDFSSIGLTLICTIMLSSFNLTKSEKKVCIKSSHNTYVGLDPKKQDQLFAEAKTCKANEAFTIIELGNGKVNIKGPNGKYVTLKDQGTLFSSASIANERECFNLTLVRDNIYSLKACNGKYVIADKNNKLQLLASSETVQEWGAFIIMDK
jgi:hypothetical protein